jgi:HEAT repeat protein
VAFTGKVEDRAIETGLLVRSIEAALRDLSGAVKAMTFYPPHHRAVTAAMERASRSFGALLASRGRIRIGIGDAVFLHQETRFGQNDAVLTDFAEYLGRRGVGALLLNEPLEDRELTALVEVVSSDPASIRARGGASRCLAEHHSAGVALEDFNLAEVVQRARAANESDVRTMAGNTTIDDLVVRCLLDPGESPPPGFEAYVRGAATDAALARGFMASLATAAAARGEDRQQAIMSALSRLAERAAVQAPEAVSSLATNLGMALRELDPVTQMGVLRSSMPIAGTNRDLAREIRGRMPERELGELIVSLVRSERKLSPRLGVVLRKVVMDREAGDDGRKDVLGAIKAARLPEDNRLHEAWKSLESLLDESEDEWLSLEYKRLLERAATERPSIDAVLRLELEQDPEIAESISQAGTERRAWVMFAELLELETSPDRMREVLDEIRKRAAAVDPDWYGAAAQVVSAVRQLVETAAMQPVRAKGCEALRSLTEQIVSVFRREFNKLTTTQRVALSAAFTELGPHAVEPLIGALRQEQNWEIRRQLIDHVVARGRDATSLLVEELGSPSWHIVRNSVLILGRIGDPTILPALAATITHPEPRVRRECVTALGRIGGAHAFEKIQRCFGDRQIEDEVLATLAAIDRPRTVGLLLALIERPSVLVHRNRRGMTGIKELGKLQAREAVPRLQAILGRGFWIPMSAGDRIRALAADALEGIATPEALTAIRVGLKSRRRAVREHCRMISSRARPSAKPALTPGVS